MGALSTHRKAATVADATVAVDFNQALDVQGDFLAQVTFKQQAEALIDYTGTLINMERMNEATETLVDKLAIHDKPGAMDKLMGH